MAIPKREAGPRNGFSFGMPGGFYDVFMMFYGQEENLEDLEYVLVENGHSKQDANSLFPGRKNPGCNGLFPTSLIDVPKTTAIYADCSNTLLFHTSFVVWNLFNPAVKPIPEHPRGLNFRCWNLQFSWELYSLSVPETAPKIRHIDLWFNVHSERGDLVIPEISQKSNHHTSIYIYTFIVQYVHVYIYIHILHIHIRTYINQLFRISHVRLQSEQYEHSWLQGKWRICCSGASSSSCNERDRWLTGPKYSWAWKIFVISKSSKTGWSYYENQLLYLWSKNLIREHWPERSWQFLNHFNVSNVETSDWSRMHPRSPLAKPGPFGW